MNEVRERRDGHYRCDVVSRSSPSRALWRSAGGASVCDTGVKLQSHAAVLTCHLIHVFTAEFIVNGLDYITGNRRDVAAIENCTGFTDTAETDGNGQTTVGTARQRWKWVSGSCHGSLPVTHWTH